MSDPLDAAVAALRDEPLAEDERTLGRVLASVERERADEGEDLLEAALGAMRDEPVTVAADEADATRRRIQTSLARGARDRRRLWLAAAAAILLAALGAPTAWAWASGQLERWSDASEGAPSEVSAPVGPPVELTPRPLPVPPPVIEAIAPSSAPSSPPTLEPGPREVTVRESAGREVEAMEHSSGTEHTTVDHTTVDHATLDPTPPAVAGDEPSPADSETLAFRDAHRAHFEARDFRAALDGWDRYLAEHPGGRYQPEARYNRALALVHLGRLREAREVLARFASTESGAYRQAEAAALVHALDERIASSQR